MRFTVQRPGNPVASPCFHDVPRRDVACRVHVRVAGVSAGSAEEFRLALAVLSGNVSTRAATLARVRGWYLLNPARSLLFKSANEQAPSGTQDPPVKSGLRSNVAARRACSAFGRAGHLPDAQILDADHVKFTGEPSGQLLAPVPPPVCLTDLELSERPLDPAAATGIMPCPGQPAFELPNSVLLPGGQAGNSQHLACRQGRGYGHASIYAHDPSVSGGRYRVRNGSKRNMPAACPVAGDAERLHASGDGTGPAEPDPAHLRHSDLSPVSAQAADVPPTALFPGDPESLVSAGFTPRRPAMRPIRECSHGLLEVTQGLLLDGLRPRCEPRGLGAGGGELPGLLKVAGPGLPAWTPPGMLFDREVPHETGVGTVPFQHDLLFESRLKSVSCHTNIISQKIHKGCAMRNQLHQFMMCPFPCGPGGPGFHPWSR